MGATGCPPPEGGGGEPRCDPLHPCPPTPPHRPAGHGGAGPPTPQRQRGRPPLPPEGPRRPGRGAQRGPPPRYQLPAPKEPRWTSKPAPAHKDATWAAPGDSKRARTGAVCGPRSPWPKRRQRHLLCCLHREGRGTDRGKATPPPTYPPCCTTGEDGLQAAPPPQPPALERPRSADPPHGERPAPSQVGGRQDRAAQPQSKPNGARDRGRTRGGALTAWNGPTRAQSTRGGGGGGRRRRESPSAHTHRGHAGNTRRATGHSPRHAQTAWNGVPESEDKGHPDGTARHTQRRKRGAGRGKRGRHKTRQRPQPPRTGRERGAHTTRALQPPRQ